MQDASAEAQHPSSTLASVTVGHGGPTRDLSGAGTVTRTSHRPNSASGLGRGRGDTGGQFATGRAAPIALGDFRRRPVSRVEAQPTLIALVAHPLATGTSESRAGPR